MKRCVNFFFSGIKFDSVNLMGVGFPFGLVIVGILFLFFLFGSIV